MLTHLFLLQEHQRFYKMDAFYTVAVSATRHSMDHTMLNYTRESILEKNHTVVIFAGKGFRRKAT